MLLLFIYFSCSCEPTQAAVDVEDYNSDCGKEDEQYNENNGDCDISLNHFCVFAGGLGSMKPVSSRSIVVRWTSVRRRNREMPLYPCLGKYEGRMRYKWCSVV